MAFMMRNEGVFEDVMKQSQGGNCKRQIRANVANLDVTKQKEAKPLLTKCRHH